MSANRLHFILIIGDVEGLLSHLVKEIKIIARYCGAKEEDFKIFLSSLQANLTIKGTPEVFKHRFPFTEEYIFDLLFYPTFKDLQCYFQDINKNIRMSSENQSGKIAIMFSGHGFSCGNISLADGDCSGSKFVTGCLKELVKDFPGSYNFDITLALNCCYALAISENMGVNKESMDLFFTFMGTNMGLTSEEVAIEFDSDELDDEKIYNDVAGLLVKITGPRSILTLNINHLSIAIWPFSVGEIKPEGAIQLWYKALLTEKVVCDTIESMLDDDKDLLAPLDSLAQSRKGDYNDDERMRKDWDEYLASNTIRAVQEYHHKPTFYIFQADKGDSVLFSWLNWNILVDGSNFRQVKKIPFLEKVLQKKKLNLLVATHSDEDHIDGLYPFTFGVEIEQLGLEIEEFFCTGDDGEPLVACSDASHSRSVPQLLKMLQRMRKVRHNKPEKSAVLGNHIFSSSLSGSYPKLDVIAVAPTTEQRDKMQRLIKEMKSLVEWMAELSGEELKKAEREQKKLSRRVNTQSNISSIVLLFIMRKCESQVQFGLLTGDAHGDASALQSDSLKNVLRQLGVFNHFYYQKPPVLSFLMTPHHGAASNKAGVLLKAVKADNIAISTIGGKPHCHPGSLTLVEIKRHMEQNRKTKLWFNYEERKEYAKAEAKSFKHAPQHVRTRLNGPEAGCNYAKVEIDFE